MPVYLLTTLRRRGLMVRSDWRVTAALQVLSLSRYNVIIPDTSLWVKCFSFVWVFFFLFGLFSFLLGYFFFQVDEPTLVRNPFSYEHLSRRVYYSWRPITPDWHSSPLKMRSGDGRGVPWIDRLCETDLCWPLYPRGWIIALQWHHHWVERLLVWLMLSVCTGMSEPDTDLVCESVCARESM